MPLPPVRMASSSPRGLRKLHARDRRLRARILWTVMGCSTVFVLAALLLTVSVRPDSPAWKIPFMLTALIAAACAPLPAAWYHTHDGHGL